MDKQQGLLKRKKLVTSFFLVYLAIFRFSVVYTHRLELWNFNCSFWLIYFFSFDRHIASFLSVFKLVLIGLIIVGKDPFAFFGMQAPSIWQWGQENKVYACMMVFFLSNMIENQCMSTGAFEITLNGRFWIVCIL